jgi:hypothetical protein
MVADHVCGTMLFEVTVFASLIPACGYDPLIGREILAQCVLVCRGRNNSFTLAQPA